jgi:hypothetical protein
MDRINVARVLIGGLVAGLVINIGEFLLNGVVLARQMSTAFARLNLPEPAGASMAMFVVLGFALGIAAVWVYAAIRPRFGVGPTTAVYAALIVWFLAYLYPTLLMSAMSLFPADVLAMGVAWGLVEVAAATVAGAWLYHEVPDRTAVVG